MKLECKVLLLDKSVNQRRLPNPVKAFVSLGQKKTEDGASHSVQISTQQNRNQTPIQLSRKNVIDIKSSFVTAGRVTMEFKNPGISLFISEANMLRIFVKTCTSIIKGEEVECNKEDEVKSTALRRPPLSVKAVNQTDYTKRSKRYPDTLTAISFTGCGISVVDVRWFQCKKLVRLDLSKNLLGSEPTELAKLRLLAELIHLKELNLSQNGMQELPQDIILPQSLLSLNLSSNQLSSVPKTVLKLGNLQRFNISSNLIVQVPPEVACMPLTTLDLRDNKIQYLPYKFIRKRLQSCFIGSNNPGIFYERIPSTTESKLCALAFAKLKQMRHDESSIPLEIRSKENELLSRCSTCMQFVAKYADYEKAIPVNPITFASSVDDNAAFPMHLVSCRECLPIVRHLFNI